MDLNFLILHERRAPKDVKKIIVCTMPPQPFSQTGRQSFTISHVAPLTLQYLLEEVGQPEDVNIQDRQKRTPLHEAARWGRLPAVEYLCEKGADIAATSTRGHTPQQEAENNMKRDTAEYLRGRKEKT